MLDEQSHREKVEEHAIEQINLENFKNATRNEMLMAYKKFLHMEELRLKILHKNGFGGFEICRRRSNLIDVVIRNIYEYALSSKSASAIGVEIPMIIAIGGYGRGLLNPGSDIDLLYLFNDSSQNLSEGTKEIIEQTLHMLWDVGFKVGHAVRSQDETFELANTDFQTKSAMIEARLIVGDPKEFENFFQDFHNKCIKDKEEEYLESRRQDYSDRHDRYANTVFLQEPHVKISPGGLRDIHNLIWTSYVIQGSKEIRDLTEKNLLSKRSYPNIMRGYNFLLRVRNQLHYLQGGGGDILTLRLQGEVAQALNYPQEEILSKIEAFMCDYYLHTKNIYLAVTSVMERFAIMDPRDKITPKFLSFMVNRSAKAKLVDGFKIRKNIIFPQNTKIFDEDPIRLMRLFTHTQLHHLHLSPQLRRLFQRNLNKLNNDFRYNKVVREEFKAILNRRGDVARILRQMNRVDFLGAYLPEFGALNCLVQHEFFHRFTADEHTLTCADKFDALAEEDAKGNPTFKKIFHRIEEPYIMYLAILLHDSGRARNTKNHSEESATLALQVCKRLKINKSQRQLLLFLVDNHLVLWRTATTKDIHDPAVIESFANIARNRIYLDSLLLFTYVDALATSEASWNNWKEGLILELYKLTSQYFIGKQTKEIQNDTRYNRKEIYKFLTKINQDEKAKHIKKFLSYMPENYFYFREKNSIRAHFKTYKLFLTNSDSKIKNTRTHTPTNPPMQIPFGFYWREIKSVGCTELAIFTKDKPHALSKVTSAFTLTNLNILSAEIFSRYDQSVLFLFRICNVDYSFEINNQKRKKFLETIKLLFSPGPTEILELFEDSPYKKDFTKRSIAPEFPYRVKLNNSNSDYYTEIEVQAIDRIRLLYDIFSVIEKQNYNIKFARINTEKGAAINTIHVSCPNGKKLTDENQIQDFLKQLDQAIK